LVLELHLILKVPHALTLEKRNALSEKTYNSFLSPGLLPLGDENVKVVGRAAR